MWQKQNQEWVRRVSMGNSWHSESDIVTPRSRAEAVTHCFVFSSWDSKSWSRPQELGLDTINLVVNEIFADFLTPDRLLFLHDLLLAHCLELHICNQVFANILCCENRPTPLLNKWSVTIQQPTSWGSRSPFKSPGLTQALSNHSFFLDEDSGLVCEVWTPEQGLHQNS